MRNLTIYLTGALCLFLSRTMAQENNEKAESMTFEHKAMLIGNKIEAITKEEKAALKLEVESVNKQLETGAITKEQADEKKQKLAEARAKSIENRVAEAQLELNQLVKDKVDGKIKEQDSTKVYGWKFDTTRHNRELNGETPTTSQFVLAGGVNNLVTKGSVANSDFGYLRSVFYEWGVTYNTRIFRENN
ncbi:MAG: hypothetical protein EOO48_10200, partial [Flavobacterium sp.]